MYFLSWHKKYQKSQGLLKMTKIILASLQENNSSRFIGTQTDFPVLFLLDNFRAAIFIGRF